MWRALLLVALLVGWLQPTFSQRVESFAVAYYDVDKMYDTLPSKFYDDSDFTPSGRLGWNTERYNRKVERVAQVIDSMAMPIVGLYGVENEQVVRDIVGCSKGDYAYLYRQSDSFDGLDFALLYYGDVFFPHKVTPWRGALCIEGEVGCVPLTLILSHRCNSLGVLLSEINRASDSNIIIIGDCGKLKFKNFGIFDASAAAEKRGYGNRISQGMWKMRDRVLHSLGPSYKAEVYIHQWLLSPEGVPLPTYDGGRYCAGYSNSLPIFIYFDKIFVH